MEPDRQRVAEQLIKEKRYDAARALLLTLDTPQSQEWLRDLALLSPPKPRAGSLWITLAASLICLVIGFAAGALVRGAATPTPATPSQNVTPTAESISTAQPITFGSDQLGFNPQIGPVHFAAGRYRARITTEGNVILTLDTDTGVCGDLIGSGRSLFNVLAGQAKQGEETIFTAQGCNAILRFNGAQKPWKLTIERMGS